MNVNNIKKGLVFCPRCREEQITPGAEFCEFCGYPLKSAVKQKDVEGFTAPESKLVNNLYRAMENKLTDNAAMHPSPQEVVPFIPSQSIEPGSSVDPGVQIRGIHGGDNNIDRKASSMRAIPKPDDTSMDDGLQRQETTGIRRQLDESTRRQHQGGWFCARCGNRLVNPYMDRCPECQQQILLFEFKGVRSQLRTGLVFLIIGIFLILGSFTYVVFFTISASLLLGTLTAIIGAASDSYSLELWAFSVGFTTVLIPFLSGIGFAVVVIVLYVIGKRQLKFLI
ncbi:MAG: zinc ribbon domain-containing protein [Promethearchaeota archaeon]